MVVEDIHWADAALPAFVKHLADWAEGVPLLLVCTARPELPDLSRLGRRLDEPSGTPPLSALGPRHGAARVGALEQAVIPADRQQILLGGPAATPCMP